MVSSFRILGFVRFGPAGNADWQSAVSRIGNPPARTSLQARPLCRLPIGDTADCQSALLGKGRLCLWLRQSRENSFNLLFAFGELFGRELALDGFAEEGGHLFATLLGHTVVNKGLNIVAFGSDRVAVK